MKHIKILAFLISLTLLSCKNEKGVKPIVQDIKELVFASGTIDWKNSYNLTAQTDGILSGVTFESGNFVTKGEELAKIDNPTNLINTETTKEQLAINIENLSDNAPALQQLKQNISFAETKYAQDKLQAERYERLYEKQSIAKAELENFQLAAQNSLSNLNALKKNYEQIQQQAKQSYIATKGQLENNKTIQQYNKIVVPQTGTIIQKLKTNGDYVKKGDIIAIIADNKQVEALLNVDETSIGKIKIGQPVYIKLNTDNSKIYNAKITEILPAFDEKSQSYICKAVFDDALTFGFYGAQLEANVFTNEKKDALLIPRDLMDFGNRVNLKGEKEYVTIKTGIISSDYVEVLEGLTKEDELLPLRH